MITTKTIKEARKLINNFKTVSFVPTMGALHSGHIELVKQAKKYSEDVVVSIFVNPTQFNNIDDFNKYPSTLEDDLKLLESNGVKLVFIPEPKEIYNENFDTYVAPHKVSQELEGKFRIGHYRGVSTVVNILFNIIMPKYAFFGEKDYQQIRVIEEMVKDLKINTEIITVKTVRDENGLALSSRNMRLSPELRFRSKRIFEGLNLAKKLIDKGELNVSKLIQEITDFINLDQSFEVEYVEIVDQVSLAKLDLVTDLARIFTAVNVNNVRLIDNIKL